MANSDAYWDPSTLHDAGMRGYTIKATCRRCGHVAVFDTYALWWVFEQKRWNDKLREAGRRLMCGPCAIAGRGRVRGPLLEAVLEPPTETGLRRPPESAWKRSVRRRRS